VCVRNPPILSDGAKKIEEEMKWSPAAISQILQINNYILFIDT
jgi:hypothetical protein